MKSLPDLARILSRIRGLTGIWTSLTSGLYPKLFNDNTKSEQIVNSANLLSKVRDFIASKSIPKRTREYSFSTSGDLLILHLLIQLMPNRFAYINGAVGSIDTDYEKVIKPILDKTYSKLFGLLEKKHKNSVLSKLLIDPKRVEQLKTDFLQEWANP